MGGGDNGCGIWLLGVTSNKLVTFPEQYSPFGLMLLRLGNVTSVCVCVYVCVCALHYAARLMYTIDLLKSTSYYYMM